jgi:hypothetical protein
VTNTIVCTLTQLSKVHFNSHLVSNGEYELLIALGAEATLTMAAKQGAAAGKANVFKTFIKNLRKNFWIDPSVVIRPEAVSPGGYIVMGLYAD